jgi:hypothetical protein
MNNIQNVLGFLIPISITTLVFLIRSYNKKKKKNVDWKLGDYISFYGGDSCPIELSNRDGLYFRLLGWDESHVYVKNAEDDVIKVDRGLVRTNKSQIWRKNFEDCKKYMGTTPLFTGELYNKKEIDGTFVYGKDIELLTETECNVYLKKAIEEENYEIAKIIREKLDSFK